MVVGLDLDKLRDIGKNYIEEYKPSMDDMKGMLEQFGISLDDVRGIGKLEMAGDISSHRGAGRLGSFAQ